MSELIKKIKVYKNGGYTIILKKPIETLEEDKEFREAVDSIHKRIKEEKQK